MKTGTREIEKTTFKNAKHAREERASKVERMEELNSAAGIQKRDLTASEQTEWKKLSGEVEELDVEIRQLQRKEDKDAEEAMKYGKKVTDGFTDNDQSNFFNVSEWRDANTGAEVRVIGNRDNLATRREEQNLSLGKAVRALITSDWKGAEAEQRALSTATGSGGVMVPATLSNRIIDMARAKSVSIRLGARTVQMDTPEITLAKVLSDPEVAWRPENTAIPISDMNFGPIRMKAHTLGGIVVLSRELAADAPNAVQVIEGALAASIAGEIDRAALFGSGNGEEPRGILNALGAEEITAVGNITNYSKFIQAYAEVLKNNGVPNGYVISPDVFATLELLTTTGGEYMLAPKAIANLAQYVSNKMPANLAFLGDFTQMLFGVRQGLLLETTTVAGETFEKHQVAIKYTFRGDVGFERPEHLVRLKGITQA